jgi:hypothetical protein
MMHPRLIIAAIAAFLLSATVQRDGVAQGAVTDYNYNPNNDCMCFPPRLKKGRCLKHM